MASEAWAGGMPTNAVTLAVTNGVFNVVLGNNALPYMTAIPATVFTDHGDVRLRVWFNDGSNGVQLLTPDQRVASVGFAIRAASADALAATATIGTSQIASGAVTAAKLATNGCADGQVMKLSGGTWVCASANYGAGAAPLGIPPQFAGHSAAIWSYFSPTSAGGAATLTPDQTVYTPTSCVPSMTIVSYIGFARTWSIYTVIPNSLSTTWTLGSLVASCSTPITNGSSCSVTAPAAVAPGTILTIFANTGTGGFLSSFSCL